MSYATETAKQTGRAPILVRVQLPVPWKTSSIAGVGGADGDGATAYSVRPLSIVSAIPTNYTAQHRVGYKAVLKSLAFHGERIDPATGRTTIGSVQIALVDPVTDSRYFATMFAARGKTRLTNLTANVTRTAASISVSPNISAAGQALFLRREVMVASSTGASPNVVRGTNAAASRQYAHTASTNAEEHVDTIYNGPRIWPGMEFAIYFGYDAAGQSESDEFGPLRFVLMSPPSWSTGARWALRGESILRLLDKPFARGTYRGRITNLQLWGSSANEGGAIWVTPTSDSNDRMPAFTTANADTYLAIGDEVIRASAPAAAVDNALQFSLSERSLVGTRREEFSVDAEVREVMPTSTAVETPRIGHVPKTGGAYTYANLVASDQPLVALLCLMLSRDGDSTNVDSASDDNSYDVLPSPWGLAIPYEYVDVDGFERAIAETKDAHFPHFRLGHKGPESLRAWYEREVAPYLPYALCTNTSGKISITSIGNVYPLDTGVTVDLDDLVDLGSSYELTGEPVGAYLIRYRESDGGPGLIDAGSVLARDLFPDHHATVEHESEGASEATRSMLIDRASHVVTRAEHPEPELRRVRMPWRLHNQITPGTVVTLTTIAPNINSGGYSVSAETWQAVEVALRSPLDADPGLEVTLRRSHGTSVGHFGPAATVTAWDGVNEDLTINANDYTPTALATTVIPLRDVEGFDAVSALGAGSGVVSQSSVGFGVAVYTRRGVIKSNVVEVSRVDYTNRLVRVPNLTLAGGGAYTVATGDVLRLCPLTDAVTAAITAGTLTAKQDDYLFMCAASLLVNTTATAYRWGL